MARKRLIIVGSTMVAAVVLIGSSYCTPRTSNMEAIEGVKSLSEKLNINYRDRLLVSNKRPIRSLLLGSDVITVVNSEDQHFLAFVSRRNKEVTALYNPKSLISSLNKIGIEVTV